MKNTLIALKTWMTTTLPSNVLIASTLCVTAPGLANAAVDNTVADSMKSTTVSDKNKTQCLPFLDRQVRQLHKQQSIDLCQLTAGKAVLIVNTASNCGFTDQFEGLEALNKKYQSQGLVVIGFPSDDFFQEENDEKDTAKVCFVNYGVTFTMLKTTPVRGSDADATFAYLADKTTAPKWNFYKYLISPDGQKIQHFNSSVAPDDSKLINAIEAVLPTSL